MIINADCIEHMNSMPPNSVHSIVTDPPYHLTSIVKRFGKPNSAPAQYGTDGVYARSSKGFMGKVWDGGDIALRPEVWAAALRVAKPGAYLLAFGGTRTFHRLAVAIEDAGWEIRDTVMWVYGSGFPKSHNVGKHIQEWDGWGTALKPAWEPVIMARKPLEGTVAANVMQYGTGAINIDGCRVEGKLDGDPLRFQKSSGGWKNQPYGNQTVRAEGRWPANVIHDGSDEVLAGFPVNKPHKMVRNRTLGARPFNNNGKATEYVTTETIEDSGGSAARFFYCAKASKADREEGNMHPTVKPTELMRYLCKLVTPPGGVVLDPFMGSGSTGKAAVLDGFGFIGIEQDAEYIAIARARIAHALNTHETRQHTLAL